MRIDPDYRAVVITSNVDMRRQAFASPQHPSVASQIAERVHEWIISRVDKSSRVRLRQRLARPQTGPQRSRKKVRPLRAVETGSNSKPRSRKPYLDGHRVRLRAYNGQIPGPTITVTPGQTLRVRMKNALPPDHFSLRLERRPQRSPWPRPYRFARPRDGCGAASVCAVRHLRSACADDQDFRRGNISTMFSRFRTTILRGQRYHPHKHGATAVQAVSGMAGPLIVQGSHRLVLVVPCPQPERRGRSAPARTPPRRCRHAAGDRGRLPCGPHDLEAVTQPLHRGRR